MKRSPYEILGLERGAMADEIKAAYRKLAMVLHPDRGGGVEDFQELNDAQALLLDAARRKLFDETGYIGKGDKAQMARDQATFEQTQMALAAVMFGGQDGEDEIEPLDVEHDDISEACAEFLELIVIQDKLTPRIQEHWERLATAKKVAKRMKAKASSPITDALRGGRMGIVKELRELTQLRQASRRAIKAFREAKYEFSERPAPPPRTMTMFFAPGGFRTDMGMAPGAGGPGHGASSSSGAAGGPGYDPNNPLGFTGPGGRGQAPR
jgi:curved DNA-binding protein CbpA